MDGFMTDLTVTEIDKQKVENKVAKIWDEDVANKYFIAKVFGIDITYGDINSLKDSNWLTDKVMDAYLTYIAQTEMDKGNIKVRHQLVSSTNNIINGKYVPGRHEKNKLIPYDFVIGAYHQRGGHWDLLIVEPSKGKVVFLNPLGASPNQKRTVLLNWRKYIGQMLLLHPENGYKNWTLEVPDHSKQLDGSSCGIFCLLFAEKYLAGQSLLGITQEEVNNKRVTIAHTLMMFEGHMVGCCPCCGFRTNADEEQLIQCKICKNLFHRKTHCVGEAFAAGTSNEDFVCEIDRTVEKN
ncbi:sentrin-specific protease 1-like [Mytilus edulis]|uniref:sentrin-specific protease 1-like n=1 Tax=Mytilus edulis TaxID=6550 RepID=UPI0039EFEEA0